MPRNECACSHTSMYKGNKIEERQYLIQVYNPIKRATYSAISRCYTSCIDIERMDPY